MTIVSLYSIHSLCTRLTHIPVFIFYAKTIRILYSKSIESLWLSAMYKCQDYWFCISTEFIGILYSKIIGSLYAKIIRYLYAHSYIPIEICSFIYIYSFMPFIVTKKVLRLFCKDQLTLTFKLNYHIWNLIFSVCPPVPF